MKLYLSMFAILLVGIIFFTQLDYLISGGRINRGTYGKNNKVLSLLFLVGVTIMLVYVAGNRYGVGSDYYAYYSAFNLNISSSFESGYVHLQNLFTADNNPFNVFTVFLSLLTVGMISASIWISGSSAYLAMYLYFTTYLYFYSMNGMRQFLAMSMITLATALTFKITRNVFIRILLLCVLTPLIANYHASVNLVLPVLIIAVLLSVAKEKVYGKIFWFGMILAILMPSINIEGILQTSLFEGFIGKYTGYLDSSLNNRLDMAHLLQMYAKLAVMGLFAYSFMLNVKHYNANDRVWGTLLLVSFLVFSLKVNAEIIARVLLYLDQFSVVAMAVIYTNEKKFRFRIIMLGSVLVYGILTLTSGLYMNISSVLPFNWFE